MPVSRSRIAGVLAAAAAALALWWLLRPQPVLVDVAEVRRGPLVATVDEEGETRVRDRYSVAASTNGRLLRIALDEGDPVAAGDVVARIEPAPLDPRDLRATQARLEAAEATQRAAEARMRRAEAALAQARRDAERAEQLHRAGTLADDARERARLAETSAVREHEEASYASEAATHAIEAARALLLAATAQTYGTDRGVPPCEGDTPCVEVRAPVAGRVLRVLVESETIVLAGTPLLEVGDPAALEIVSDLLSRDAVRVTPGARVIVEDWGGPGALEARVRRVEPSGFTKISALGVEEQRVNVIADLVAPEPRLGDGYRVEVRIVTWEGAEVVQIPASALFRKGEAWAVFVAEGGRARERVVEVGEQAPFDVEIRAGLEPGETVVLHPSDRLRDGVRVASR